MSFSKLSLFLALLFLFFQTPAFAAKQSYIVYMGVHSHGLEDAEATVSKVKDSHCQFLASFLESSEKAKEAIFYSYSRDINGFAATLEDEEAAAIERHPNVVSVFLNKAKHLHTTHSWDFMLLEKNGVVHNQSIWKRAAFGQDVIIANLDTGVWPESESFRDDGFGPVPSKWKGFCQNDTRTGVPCNRKIIGARYFNKAYVSSGGQINSSTDSARDNDGHGSHTLSTAGGNFVAGANVFGVFNGTAKGGSPNARVASYRVCFPPVSDDGECYDGDILEAFDAAIQDGVDVISVSLGGDPVDYFNDTTAIGAFHAVKNGIVVVCSAGNDGPKDGSVTNVAPWIITVGASTMDREFENYVELHNQQRFKGTSISKSLLDGKLYPLITGAQAVATNGFAGDAMLCKGGTLDPRKVKGKIVACLRGEIARVEKGMEAAQAGAVGMILCNDELSGNEIIADPHVLPASHINYTDGLAVLAYINSTNDPLGLITNPMAKLNTKPAPFMASFSSKGPNTVTPEILKPDITAPGVSVIAAYTGAQSPTGIMLDTRRTAYNTESGTSMSCPHVSGVAGLLKKLHPDWSPAAIKSAIMTSARTRDNTVNPMVDGASVEATPLSYGAGHIRPNRAMDPGLVYDLTVTDYLNFLCALGYNQSAIQLVSKEHYNCPANASLLNFNYPSITVPKLCGSVTMKRTVKNVGSPTAVYAARLRQPVGFSVSVEPKILKFDKIGEEKSFELTLTNRNGGGGGEAAAEDYVFGELLWSDGHHYVRSPIVVAANAAAAAAAANIKSAQQVVVNNIRSRI